VSDTTFTAGFVEASRFLVSAVGAVPGDRWDGPGLGGWSLRELVAHANRGQTLVGEYLLRPRPPEPPESDYFTEEAVAARAATPSSRWVPIPRPPSRPRRRRSSRSWSGRQEAVIGSPAGSMPLARCLRRGRPNSPSTRSTSPTRSARTSPRRRRRLRKAWRSSHTARLPGPGQGVLLALTARGQLPRGYSVY
jgi:hypothetical protein